MSLCSVLNFDQGVTIDKELGFRDQFNILEQNVHISVYIIVFITNVKSYTYKSIFFSWASQCPSSFYVPFVLRIELQISFKCPLSNFCQWTCRKLQRFQFFFEVFAITFFLGDGWISAFTIMGEKVPCGVSWVMGETSENSYPVGDSSRWDAWKCQENCYTKRVLLKHGVHASELRRSMCDVWRALFVALIAGQSAKVETALRLITAMLNFECFAWRLTPRKALAERRS